MNPPRYWYFKGKFPLHVILTFFPYMRRSQSCPDLKIFKNKN